MSFNGIFNVVWQCREEIISRYSFYIIHRVDELVTFLLSFIVPYYEANSLGVSLKTEYHLKECLWYGNLIRANSLVLLTLEEHWTALVDKWGVVILFSEVKSCR